MVYAGVHHTVTNYKHTARERNEIRNMGVTYPFLVYPLTRICCFKGGRLPPLITSNGSLLFLARFLGFVFAKFFP